MKVAKGETIRGAISARLVRWSFPSGRLPSPALRSARSRSSSESISADSRYLCDASPSEQKIKWSTGSFPTWSNRLSIYCSESSRVLSFAVGSASARCSHTPGITHPEHESIRKHLTRSKQITRRCVRPYDAVAESADHRLGPRLPQAAWKVEYAYAHHLSLHRSRRALSRERFHLHHCLWYQLLGPDCRLVSGCEWGDTRVSLQRWHLHHSRRPRGHGYRGKGHQRPRSDRRHLHRRRWHT